MTVTPDELLKAADEMLEGAREVDYRNSASRAYYSAYHLCKAFSETEGLPEQPTKRSGLHERLISKFKNHPAKQGGPRRDWNIRTVGILLGNARSHRTSADYKINEQFHKSNAELTIGNIKEIKALLKQS